MLPYLTKLSIAIMVVFLFYHLLLRRLTFYQWNRWYLLLYSAGCFLIPFIDINPFLQSSRLDEHTLVHFIPRVSGEGIRFAVSETPHWFVENWIGILFVSGIVLLTFRLMVQHYSLVRLRRSAQLLVSDNVKLYQVNKPIIPFSFGNAIFVNQLQHSEQELKEIIRHEFIHVKQGHTLDMLYAELFCIMNWYNPFAWLLRNAIRQNLEFIADREVLKKGIDKKEYQYLLLKVIGVSQFSIATNFNFSSLKKRIAMMNKMRTAKVHLLKFLFLLPVLLVLLVSFRKQILLKDQGEAYYVFNDTIPSSSTHPGVKLPDNVRSIKVQNDLITVLLKDGTIEKYDQRKPEELAAFEKKYGALPPPPPPPLRPSSPSKQTPPPPPPPAAPRSGIDAPAPPAAPALPSRQDWAQASVNKKGYLLSVADNNGECVVIIKNKAGKIEKSMLLTDWTANEKANEARYGVLPPPPPPAPAPAQAPRFGVKDPGGIPAPGADAGIIQAPGEGYYLKADKIEYTPGAKEGSDRIRMSAQKGITIKGKSDALIVIDGVVQESHDALSRLDPNTITQIEVLKNESAVALYGEKARMGVLIISTGKDGSSQPLKLSAQPAKEASPALQLSPKTDEAIKGDAEAAFYVVDGKEYSKEEYKKLNLQGQDIESIHIWKGDSAVRVFGERGRAGVIEIKKK